jgi:hypothetical protein
VCVLGCLVCAIGCLCVYIKRGSLWLCGCVCVFANPVFKNMPYILNFDGGGEVEWFLSPVGDNDLQRTGQVLSWGTNDFGQLGIGTTEYATLPVPVEDLDPDIADICAGGWHSLAINKYGEVFTWGRGEYGRLGVGDRSGASKMRPCQVNGIGDHMCAAPPFSFHEPNELLTALKPRTDVANSKVFLFLGHSVVQASCGGTHTLLQTSEGRMFAFGRGSFGRLGASMKVCVLVCLCLYVTVFCVCVYVHIACVCVYVYVCMCVCVCDCVHTTAPRFPESPLPFPYTFPGPSRTPLALHAAE